MTEEEERIERRQRNILWEEQVKRIPELEERIQQLLEETRRLVFYNRMFDHMLFETCAT